MIDISGNRRGQHFCYTLYSPRGFLDSMNCSLTKTISSDSSVIYVSDNSDLSEEDPG